MGVKIFFIMRKKKPMFINFFIHSRRPTTVETRSGFTLIEVMVSMVILILLILLVVNLFNGTSVAWDIGMKKAELGTAGRSTLDFMSRELVQAVAGPIESPRAGAGYLTFSLSNEGKDIGFVAFGQTPTVSTRSVRGVWFWYNGTNLMYARETEDIDYYDTLKADWSTPPNSRVVLVENVTSFEITAYDSDDLSGQGDLNYESADNDNLLPFCVDIFLEVLSEADMKTYNAGVPDPDAFRDRNAKSFATRVYFPNRDGFKAR